MSRTRHLLLAVSLASVTAGSGCQRGQREPPGADTAAVSESSSVASPTKQALGGAAVTDRKVVQSASLALVVPDPSKALTAARAIAERHGGYLVQSTHSGSPDRPEEDERVNATLKVKADRFEAALGELRGLGSSAGTESIRSEDVTEQYVDLDARLRTQRRVEEQYLNILTQAKTVTETLEVHKQLGVVRTEIEQLEGKRRLLEHQIQLSSVEVSLERREPLLTVSFGRLGRAIRSAGADVVNVAGWIVLGTIRAVGVVVPFALLVLLPLALLLRWVYRRHFTRPAAPP